MCPKSGSQVQINKIKSHVVFMNKQTEPLAEIHLNNEKY